MGVPYFGNVLYYLYHTMIGLHIWTNPYVRRELRPFSGLPIFFEGEIQGSALTR